MITSPQNPLIKRIGSLSRKRSYRLAERAFVIEGEKELLSAFVGGIAIEALIYCPDLIESNSVLNTESRLVSRLAAGCGPGGPAPMAVSGSVYAKIAYRTDTCGLLAIGQMPELTIDQLKLPKLPLILVVDHLENPGNLGALLRTADAAGLDSVIVCETTVDLYNPNVVRSSLGALFTTPCCLADCDRTIAWLVENGLEIFAASPQSEQNYTDADYTAGTAIVLGSESAGLSAGWLCCDDVHCVRIPMHGRVDSLNVSCSGAIILYEALRQRNCGARH